MLHSDRFEVHKTEGFTRWLNKLKDIAAAVSIAALATKSE